MILAANSAYARYKLSSPESSPESIGPGFITSPIRRYYSSGTRLGVRTAKVRGYMISQYTRKTYRDYVAIMIELIRLHGCTES